MVKEIASYEEEISYKISDIASVYTKKLLLDNSYENPPIYLIGDVKNGNDIGDILSDDKTETLFIRKEFKILTHNDFDDLYVFFVNGGLTDAMDEFVDYLGKQADNNRDLLQKEISINIVKQMLTYNKNKVYICKMTDMPLHEIYDIEKNIQQDNLPKIFQINKYNQKINIKIQEIVKKHVYQLFFNMNRDDISNYPIDFLISNHIENIFKPLKYTDINNLIYDFIDNFSSALGDLIECIEKNVSDLNIETNKKVAQKIAMRMMANGDDWQYISDVTNISINELEIYQWFMDRWNK